MKLKWKNVEYAYTLKNRYYAVKDQDGIKLNKTSNDATWFLFPHNTDCVDMAEPINDPEGFVLSEKRIPRFYVDIYNRVYELAEAED